MYKRFKITDDGKYLDPDGQEVLERLEGVARRRQEEDPEGTQYSQALDIDSYVTEVGLTSRSGLPRLLGSAATLVEGTPFQLSQHVSRSMPSVNMASGGASDSLTLAAVMEQMLKRDEETRAEIARRDAETRAEIARRDEEARAREEAMMRRSVGIESLLHTELQRVTELLQRALASRPEDPQPPPPRS